MVHIYFSKTDRSIRGHEGTDGYVKVQLYPIFNLGARWGGCLTPLPGRFTAGAEARHQLCRRLGGPRGRLEFKPRTVQCVASRRTDYAIPSVHSTINNLVGLYYMFYIVIP